MTVRRVLLVAVLLSSLTACNDDPTPEIPDPTPTSASPTVAESTSSPTAPPETPEAMTPEETVRAWFSAFTVALQTGDAGRVRELSGPTCVSCTGVVDQVVSVYDRGGRFESRGWRTQRLTAAPTSTPTEPVFVMQVLQAAQELFDASGASVDSRPAQTTPMRMTLTQKDQSWIVKRLEILK